MAFGGKRMAFITGVGLKEWKWQRFSAIIMTLYMFTVGIVYLYHAPISYETWFGLFSHPFMRLATLFVLLCLVIHAWIGIWTVLTDYVKFLWIRYLIQTVVLFLLFGYVMWGFLIMWGL